MDLENVKRWHWALLGLLAGFLWAGSRLMSNPEMDGQAMGRPFYALLLASEKAPGAERAGVERHYLSDLRVHPPFPADKQTRVLSQNMSRAAGDDASVAEGAMVQWVTGTLHVLEPGKDPKTGKPQIGWFGVPKNLHETRQQPFYFLAAVPFKPDPNFDWLARDFVRKDLTKSAGYKNPEKGMVYADIRKYFDQLNLKYGSSTIGYRYAWWETKAAMLSLYPVAGVVLIGGVWPTALSLMIGAGLGRKREAGDGYDLSRFKGTSKAAMPKPKSNAMTEADHAQLAALGEELERRLEADASPRNGAPGGNGESTPLPAKVLTTQPAEAVAQPQTPRPQKAFGAANADFYPTEIHVPAKKEE